MIIEFYHVDAFEIANFEAIWRQLLLMGVDARLVAVEGERNTAATGWFDFDRFDAYCGARGIEYKRSSDPAATLGVTTQNAGILRDYGKRIRLMYGASPFPPGWSMQPHSVKPFDAVLVHGQFHADWFTRWLPRDRLPIVGYPRYDDFFAGRIQRHEIRRRWGFDESHTVLAFMPTWADNTAFDSFFPALLALRQRFQIVLRPHHCTLRMEPQRMALMHASGLVLLDNAYDLSDIYAGADVVVADVRSGSMFEACMCQLPTVGMVPDRADLDGWIAAMKVAEVIRLCDVPSELERAVDEALTSAEMTARRRTWADRHVAYRDGTAAQHAAEALVRLASPRPFQVVAPRVFKCKVSVVLPTYNHLQYLPQAVDSIMKQRMTDFELIIVNDGSTDATADYLATLNDPRIQVIERDNGGLPSALNCGFLQATGEYRTWTSADNIVGPTWLGQLVAALDAAPHSVGFACSPFALINSDDHFIAIRRGQNVQFDHVIAKNPGIASFLYRTTVAEQVGRYDETLTGAEDWDMWLRILEVSDPVYVDDLLYYYRLHANSMTSTIPEKVAKASAAALESLRRRQGGGFDLDRIYPRLSEAENASLARWQARIRLAACLIDSPFCQPAWSASLLIEALNERYAPEVHRNLLHLLCRHGGWELALRSIDEAYQQQPSPFDEVRRLVETRDARIFQACPIYQVPDNELAFKLSRAAT